MCHRGLFILLKLVLFPFLLNAFIGEVLSYDTLPGLDPRAIIQCGFCTCTYIKKQGGGIVLRSAGHCEQVSPLFSPTLGIGYDCLKSKGPCIRWVGKHQFPETTYGDDRVLYIPPEALENAQLQLMFKDVKPVRLCSDHEVKKAIKEKSSGIAVGASMNTVIDPKVSKMDQSTQKFYQKYAKSKIRYGHGKINQVNETGYVKFDYSKKNEGLCKQDSGGPLLIQPNKKKQEYCLMATLTYQGLFDLYRELKKKNGDTLMCSTEGYYTTSKKAHVDSWVDLLISSKQTHPKERIEVPRGFSLGKPDGGKN